MATPPTPGHGGSRVVVTRGGAVRVRVVSRNLVSYAGWVLPRAYNDQNCSLARALEVVGDRWTLLVIRDAFEGVRRFDDFQADLNVARNVLADRLGRLCDEGILRRRKYQERPDRYEYRLTRKGVGLWPVIMSLLQWGDAHYAPGGPPVLVAHRGCGGLITPALTCDDCGASLGPADVERRPGPGARPGDPILDATV